VALLGGEETEASIEHKSISFVDHLPLGNLRTALTDEERLITTARKA